MVSDGSTLNIGHSTSDPTGTPELKNKGGCSLGEPGEMPRHGNEGSRENVSHRELQVARKVRGEIRENFSRRQLQVCSTRGSRWKHGCFDATNASGKSRRCRCGYQGSSQSSLPKEGSHDGQMSIHQNKFRLKNSM